VIGPDNHPVANTPVEIAGGIPAELTGEVIGDPQPCPPENPNCQPEKPARKPVLGLPPVDCAAVLQKVREAATPAATANIPSPAASGPDGVPQVVTDSAGRFALCVSPTAPELNVNLPGGQKTIVKADRDLPPAPEIPPDFFQPGQKVSVNGLIRDPQVTQSGRTWPLPVVHAWSPDGRRTISALQAPKE
jgi:hypothetical protein